MTCPNGEEYQHCSTSCARTCQDRDSGATCDNKCVRFVDNLAPVSGLLNNQVYHYRLLIYINRERIIKKSEMNCKSETNKNITSFKYSQFFTVKLIL